jgi:methylthioribose-1-phosphate isomerase
MFSPIAWENHHVRILDQTRLPSEVVWLDCRDVGQVAEAIRALRVRGAPLIGITAAMGAALGALTLYTDDPRRFEKEFDAICGTLAATRPTAVNLFWALRRMRQTLTALLGNRNSSIEAVQKGLIEEARRIHEEDITSNRAIGRHGAALFPAEGGILTHCNTGALATGGYGTALGVIRAAHGAGKRIQVYVDETRPVLQGSRLTMWELMQEKIPATLITDNMAGYLMKQGKIAACIVGADRIAANGDTANKIGTYSVAVLARAHGIPFYVAAPSTTVDLSTPSGEKIPIEERPPEEIRTVFGKVSISPADSPVYNPAFDVTPAALITAIITENGVFKPGELNRKTV